VEYVGFDSPSLISLSIVHLSINLSHALEICGKKLLKIRQTIILLRASYAQIGNIVVSIHFVLISVIVRPLLVFIFLSMFFFYLLWRIIPRAD